MKLLNVFSWICWPFVFLKAKFLSFNSNSNQVLLNRRSRVLSPSRHTGGSFSVCLQARRLNGRLAQAEAPSWIALGVILTCSLAVKSWMFWFILSPITICLGLFSAMEGFCIEELAKVGSVYIVHAGKNLGVTYLLTLGIMSPKCIHEHMLSVSYVHNYSNKALRMVHFTCLLHLLHKWVFALSQHLFLILYNVIKAAEVIDADVQSLPVHTPEPHREWESTSSLFMLVLFWSNSCFNVWFFFFLCIWAPKQWTTEVNAPQ